MSRPCFSTLSAYVLTAARYRPAASKRSAGKTTLETNRDEKYREISKSPFPTMRFYDFLELDYPRKVLTIEPVLDFDLEEFVVMVLKLHRQGTLEYVWFGFDSKNCGLPEPSIEKAQKFVDILQSNGLEVRGKSLRGVMLKETEK